MSDNKTILITGAGTRLGRETALHLAAKGWDVAVHYRDSGDAAAHTVRDIIALGRKAVAIKGDLTDEARLEVLVDAASTALGAPLTALVNNAAAFGKDSIDNFDRHSWLRHMDTNLYAPLRLIAAFAAQLPEDSEGAVVNLIDGCEAMCLSPQFLTYTLSKYGLAEATRLLAQDLAPRIRVNGISPGLTLPKAGEEEMFGRLIARLPLQRATEPEAIASAVAYLLESPAITGQILALDGGAAIRRNG